MQKNILLSILITFFVIGLQGCSCSSKPSEDPEITPGIHIEDFQFSEANEGETQVTLNVKLERDNSSTVTVQYEVMAHTSNNESVIKALVGSDSDADVRAATGTLTFDETVTSNVLQIPITIVNDTIYELDELFMVKLSSASGADIVTGTAEITLENDDAPPIASIELLNDASTTKTLSEATLERVAMRISLKNAAGENIVSGVDAPMEMVSSSELPLVGDNHGLVAANRIDYLIYKTGETSPIEPSLQIDAGNQELFIELEAIDDGLKEFTEVFELSLKKSSEHVSVAAANILSFTIQDDDTPAAGSPVVQTKLNDTGVIESIGNLSDLRPYMDFSIGLDKDGAKGFSYTKLRSIGDALPDNADYEETPWNCVKDNNTGLIWEKKTRGDAGLQAETRNFYWYDPNFTTNGGVAGERGQFRCAENALSTCSTAYYVADINAMKLCGLTGWRVPTMEELRSIVDYGITAANTAGVHLDTEYFGSAGVANTYHTWTSTTDVNNPDNALTISFAVPLKEESFNKSNDSQLSTLRLVNDTQVQAAE